MLDKAPLDAPDGSPSYLSAPFFDGITYRQAMAWLLAPPKKKPTLMDRRRAFLAADFTEYDRLFLPRGPKTRDDYTQAKAFSFEWQQYGFTYAEVRAWLDGGLKPTEAYRAVMLYEEGITPDRLYEACQDRNSGEPATILVVARQYSNLGWYGDIESFSDYLDRWQVARNRRGPRRFGGLTG